MKKQFFPPLSFFVGVDAHIDPHADAGCLRTPNRAKPDKNRDGILSRPVIFYRSQLRTVRGKGIASRMLPMPVRYMTQRSKPRPKPA